MLSQTTKFPVWILILKTINISQPCLLTQHWEFIATSCYNQQKLCTVRHCTIPWTRHCWLKSKQKHFCLPQNTPKRCILHSNTHLDPLIKCPKQKITQPLHLHINSQHFQALGPAVFVPLTAHCQKSIHFNQKCLKNIAIFSLLFAIRKKTLSGSCPYVSFFLRTVKNLVLRSKNAAIYTTNSR